MFSAVDPATFVLQQKKKRYEKEAFKPGEKISSR